MEKLKLSIQNFGPIREAHLAFGDLTFLIGPQGSGKSLALELLKFVVDKQHILSTLRSYNYILNKKDAKNFIECYFGEGLSGLFRPNTAVTFAGQPFSLDLSGQGGGKGLHESVFYVPAQRILAIADGRPKNFMEFDTSAPYVLRRFSEILRVFMQGGLGNPDIIFPIKTRLKGNVKKSINATIFHDAKVVIDQASGQRKMKLDVDGMRIPFMAWSAGQKEFMPLLLAVYCLSGPPTHVVRKEDYQWVVIEEPEMGLHPRAILSVLLEVLELIQNGYKVVISTHSSIFLDFAWAFRQLQPLAKEKFKQAFCDMFEISPDSTAASLFDDLQNRCIRTYYSNQTTQGVTSL